MDKQLVINRAIAEMDKVASITDSPKEALAAVDFIAIYNNLTDEKLKKHLKVFKNGYKKWIVKQWNQRRYETIKKPIVDVMIPKFLQLRSFGMSEDSTLIGVE